MNHYERLKVSQDAPPEVIRAAYRALATKLHPDRQGADTGPDDVMHEQMAALNSAYEVLIDPKLRQDYDATLVHARPRLPDPNDSEAFPDSGVQSASTRVDMDWLVPTPASSSPFAWPPSKPVMLVGGSAVAVVVLATAGFAWHLAGQQQVDRALSDQYAAQPAEERQARLEAPEPVVTAAQRTQAVVADAGAGGSVKAPTTGKRRPTVDELSRMTDEELLKVLPALDGDADTAPAAAATASARGGARGARQHPLDGKPLNLRTDTQLVDPLAPESAAGTKAKSRP